jgi:hypothetical protein
LIGNYLLVSAARLHARLSGSLLSKSVDPLATAKQMLALSPHAAIESLDPSPWPGAGPGRSKNFGDLPFAEHCTSQP